MAKKKRPTGGCYYSVMKTRDVKTGAYVCDGEIKVHVRWTNWSSNCCKAQYRPHEDTWPIHAHAYQVGPQGRDLRRNDLNNMTKKPIAQAVITEWAWPILFAPKKDGTVWFCVENCCLNPMNMKESCSARRMDEYIDFQEDARVFFTLNANPR